MIALAGKATSIRTRLYFATVFSLLLLVGVGLLGYVGLDRTRDTVAVLFKQHVQTLTDMSDLRTTLGEMRRVEKDIILNFNNAVEVASQREIWAKTLASLRTRLAAVRTLKADEASFTTAIDKTLQEVKQYEDGVSPVFAQIEAAQLDGAGGAAYADKFKGHMEASDELLAGLFQQARAQMDEARAGVDARAASLSLAMLVAVLLALAIVLPLTIFTLRSITASLAQARGLAEHIAAGDLSQDVAPRSQDELGQLVLTMGRMQEALRTLVRQVQEAAGNISTASAEIATGNMDLSQRTEQTAANLEEVAASMDMLTGTVQHNADNSRSASASATEAGAVASPWWPARCEASPGAAPTPPGKSRRSSVPRWAAWKTERVWWARPARPCRRSSAACSASPASLARSAPPPPRNATTLSRLARQCATWTR